MTNQFYGQLDLTKIAALVQQQPELVKYVNFRDGEHMLLPINVNDMMKTDVQRMLGHSDIKTTTIYAISNDEEVKREHEKYLI